LGLNDWKEFVSSSDYNQVMGLCKKILEVNSSNFQALYGSLMKTISERYSPEVAKGIQKNLGNGPHDKMNPEIVIYELKSNIIPGLQQNNNPDNYCLSIECFLVIQILKGSVPKLDFTYLEMNRKSIDIKERCEIYENAVKN
jgi:hypothetical protein